ncbi:Ketosamine-3-kinase [Phlyctema vagabunda]|uniref:protein-ribulosamine 3-kinase n=1 Tax=Phlyctema vagabunda TaxID=108571 RepID=A0ABR4PDD4_9HELO
MPAKVDSAILKALALDPAKTTIASHGGSGFSTTQKITSTDEDGVEKCFFIKTGHGKEAGVMFEGEHTSLNSISSAVPSFCPRSYAHGPLCEKSGGHFLATDFLTLTSKSRSSSKSLTLAQKLSKLHSIAASTPPGFSEPQFGFPVPTCCGNTEQDNTFKSSWAEFYADNRLRQILQASEKNNGRDKELHDLVERTAEEIVPRLLGDGHLTSPDGGKIVPVVVHGDLWSGNHGTGKIGTDENVEEVVYDPSSCYAHAEFEFGIMKMFGGFGGTFWEWYYEGRDRDRPVEEWSDRAELYELYHHLNHYAMFGGSYKGGAVRIMKKLLEKYG